MNWRNLVAAVGLVVVAGVPVVVWQANNGVRPADLVDAGILDDCNAINVACPAIYCDGGKCSKPRFVARRGAWCGTDGGLVLPDLPPGAEWFRVDLCKRVTRDAGVIAAGEEEDEPFDCACRGDGGVCRVRLDDGGIGPAPFGETIGPGYRFEEFGGAGCVPKSCGALAQQDGTDDSWPETCPQ